MNRFVAKLAIVSLSAIAIAAPVMPASASEGSESGVNIGFAMDWFNPAPLGSSASFLRDDAQTLSNCGGHELSDPNYSGCSFLFETELDGQVADSFIDLSSHPYDTVASYVEAADNSICLQSGQFFMLTNFNCFNDNSYGQIFRPTSTAALTNFQMAITCLADAPISFWAVLYELEPGINGNPPVAYSSITGDPIGAYEITLSDCASSWQNKTFSASDFEVVNMDFGDPQLTAGTSYGVYFAGEFVPGAQIIDVETLDVSGDVSRDVERAVANPYNGPVLSGLPAGPFRPGSSAAFSGQNLDSISSVVVDGIECAFSVVDGTLTVTIPAGLVSGTYDLEITSDFGNLIVQSAMVISGTPVTTSDAIDSAGTKRTGDSFRVYYFDPVNKGKVQFFVNGKEIAWVNATTSSDPKLRTITKDGVETSYLVRELDLKAGKNVIEIHVDGVRVKRVAYTLD